MTSAAEPGVVLVTGAGRRIGREIALAFARWRWAVGVHWNRSESDARAVVAEIAAAGGRAVLVPGDLSTPEGPEVAYEACRSALGAPCCVVNNASMFEYDEIHSLDMDRWDAHHAVNLRAPVFLARLLAVGLPTKRDGIVVNILDQRVWKPTPHYLSYATSKAALWEATRMLAQGLAPRVRVNAIAPGPTLKNESQSDAEFEAQARATILGRGTTPAEIAAAIRFILDAPALTGQMIALDGGQHLAWQTPDVGDGRG
jgi:NAD(P)-dependent dehydrogenase (short-subunit alcohol dehydrogenase family)